ETITNKNNNLTHIVLTNTEDFYIIDAKVYATFAKDKAILKAFKNCEHREGNDASTKKFYEELNNLLPALDMEIQYTHFRVEDSTLANCHSELSPCHSESLYHSEPALAGEESRHTQSKRDVSALPQHDKIPNTSTLESEIDSLVYQLYNLTDEEIRIIENKEKLMSININLDVGENFNEFK
ncbi:MAG: hypothetical protein HDT10_07995, partial [Helicobacter sp.]|nr:hypothetical protein [Helicobacter sp.]